MILFNKPLLQLKDPRVLNFNGLTVVVKAEVHFSGCIELAIFIILYTYDYH